MMSNTRKEEMEALVDGILTECASKGFTIRETERLCRALTDKCREASAETIRDLPFTYSANKSPNETSHDADV